MLLGVRAANADCASPEEGSDLTEEWVKGEEKGVNVEKATGQAGESRRAIVQGDRMVSLREGVLRRSRTWRDAEHEGNNQA
jgi:hypothetical protein